MSVRPKLDGRHEEMHLWVGELLEKQGLSWRAFESGELWKTKAWPFDDLDDLWIFLIGSDPVRFVETCLFEREVEGHPPWRLWPYQKVSMRHPGNTIHQCGSEVGKTREIVGLAIYRLICGRGDQLFAGALDAHCEMAYKEITWQLEHNPWLENRIKRTAKKPYKEIEAENGNLIFFRPAGTTGGAFRSAHVKQAGYFDEAPHCVSEEAWAQFFTRMKPGAPIKIYGVPNGLRESKFYELSQKWEECDSLDPKVPAPGGYTKFRWSQKLKPPPYWSDERDDQLARDLGGRSSSKYAQQVEGFHGDPTSSVFPWAIVKPCVRRIPGYRVLELGIDSATAEVRIDVHALNDGYVVGNALGDDDAVGEEPMRRIVVETEPVAAFEHGELEPRIAAWERLFRRFLPEIPQPAIVGGDLGYQNDPTQLLIGTHVPPDFLLDASKMGNQYIDPRHDGPRRRLSWGSARFFARIELRKFDYPTQEAVLRAVHRVVSPEMGHGYDAGGAGTPILQFLDRTHGDEGIDFTAVFFNGKIPDRDPDTGEVAKGADGKPLLVDNKEYATRLLELAFQRQEIELPYDELWLNQLAGHVATIHPTTGSRRFPKKKDDIVDAARCFYLRRHAVIHGDGRAIYRATAAVRPRSGSSGHRPPRGKRPSFNGQKRPTIPRYGVRR